MTDKMLDIEIEKLNQKINVMSDDIRKLVDLDSYRMMSVSDIAKMLGINPKTLYRKPWLLPNFGKTQNSTMEWTKKEVAEWLDKGTDYLIEEYKKVCNA